MVSPRGRCGVREEQPRQGRGRCPFSPGDRCPGTCADREQPSLVLGEVGMTAACFVQKIHFIPVFLVQLAAVPSLSNMSCWG